MVGLMAVTDLLARRATLARSLRLLGQFRYEQRDPARFYGALAADSALRQKRGRISLSPAARRRPPVVYP